MVLSSTSMKTRCPLLVTVRPQGEFLHLVVRNEPSLFLMLCLLIKFSLPQAQTSSSPKQATQLRPAISVRIVYSSCGLSRNCLTWGEMADASCDASVTAPLSPGCELRDNLNGLSNGWLVISVWMPWLSSCLISEKLCPLCSLEYLQVEQTGTPHVIQFSWHCFPACFAHGGFWVMECLWG